MPLYAGSRYEDDPITPVLGSDGVFHATIQPPLGRQQHENFSLYRVVPGDRLDALAATAYGDPELWWRIAEANPELPFPDELQPGMLLRIPVLDEATF